MEESIEMIIGLVMMYSWVHAGVIIVPRLKKVTGYEKVVLIVATVGILLFIIGSV